MEERIVAQGKRGGKPGKYKVVIVVTLVIALLFAVLGIVSSISEAGKDIESHKHSRYCYRYSYRDDFYKDNKNNNLQDFKMDCDYMDGAFSLGMGRYMEGGFVLPFLVVVIGLIIAFTKKANSRGYDIIVTEEGVQLTYAGRKPLEIPMCSIFMVEKTSENNMSIVTSEDSYKLPEMEGCNEVFVAIQDRMPTITIKGPANSEQVLAKGYPPAIKPWLLVLTILLAMVAVIGGIAAEEFGIVLVCMLPAAFVFVFYLLAKTPYLVVTDKRVFYVSDFGRKLSLPLNKITVTVTHSWFRQLHIAAPAGRIHLFGVRNTAELYDIIAALINEMQ